MAAPHRYQLVYHTLKHRIEESIYEQEARIPSARDLALEFQTTPVTVDRALGLLVREGYIRRVPKSGSFVNLKSQWFETKVEQTANGLIGAIVFDASVSFYWSQVVADIEQAVSDAGMHLVIGHSQHDPNRAIRYVQELSQKGIEGFIFAPIDTPTSEEYEAVNGKVVDALVETGRPFVLFDRVVGSRTCSAVSVESAAASRDLVTSLLDAGCRNPICLSLHYSSVIGDRETAFAEVASKAGISNAKGRIVRIPADRVRDAHLAFIEQVLADRPKTDGIFAINSSVTNAVLKVVGGTKPHDKPHIVGFEELELVKPERMLRTASQPVHDLGSAAGTLIVNLVKGTVEPMWRNSTARISIPCVAGPVK